ncbi:class I SAM-dependent methyltransferase [Mycobacterium cookii]|uniref:S-adenosyl-L-methionine-dependent methyltransferase n=1 Tax=Mycobacterium cookii TaxID=1775 RepID=A0A7I7L031_9MYCO|nr:class I SAM-dependent methyltransferase [Mycobacterium cookii]MCV7331640.1 class I SAM-dependent methyltransferase [Mycobacterium cookii]BBX46932.1 putative S-adenosyl-L-methionine-dependent methyltransferase [Mycobacterium cookii]
MPRTDNDSWEITESVGSTALGVAAARAAETESADPLIRDPFARVFLDAVGNGVWSLTSDPGLASKLADIAPDAQAYRRVMVDFMAVRTAWYDQIFLDAVAAGVRQVVILAAGLDARTWRLPWPDGTTVYEVDQAKVLNFKSVTLQGSGAQPRAKLVNVAADLRHDWPTALREAGFDASKPTMWSAEGLLRYLPAAAQDLLFERIDSLSPSGTWLATNLPDKNAVDPGLLSSRRELSQRFHAAAAQVLDAEIPDMEELWYPEERTDLTAWLGEHGWDASAIGMADLLTRYGRAVPSDVELPPVDFVSARRS